LRASSTKKIIVLFYATKTVQLSLFTGLFTITLYHILQKVDNTSNLFGNNHFI